MKNRKNRLDGNAARVYNISIIKTKGHYVYGREKIKTFAELILRLGVNVQKGQPVLINCPVEKAEIGRIFAEKAYEVGASYVKIKYGDEKLARINYLHAAEEVLCDVPPSAVAEKLELLERGYCYVSIVAEDPNILKGLDEKKIANVNKAFSKANKNFTTA